MRIFGGILLVLGIVEFGIGGTIYGFLTNVHLGGWWAGILAVVSAILALVSTNRAVVVTGGVFAGIGIIIAIIAAIVDGLSSNVFRAFDGCYNPTNGQTYGDFNLFCSTITSTSHNCWCYQTVSATSSTTCFGYNLASGDNCDGILTKYAHLLSASTAFCSLIAIILLVYCIFTCVQCCCTPQEVPAPPVVVQGTATPVVVVATPDGMNKA
eukprot:gene16408-22373_t